MPKEVFMPKLGATMVEGEVSKWLKKSGDFVNDKESLVEVSTDKIVYTLESPGAGYLEILVGEGQTKKVSEIIGLVHKNEPDNVDK